MLLQYLLWLGDQSAVHRAVEFVKDTKPDILCMSELNNWHDNHSEKLNCFIKLSGYEHSHFIEGNGNSPFNMGIFSNYPLSDKKAQYEGFGHGAAIATANTPIGTVKIFLTHLESQNAERRTREAKWLDGEVVKSQRQGVEAILLGDLNSLSPDDNIDEDRILALQKESGKYKFGVTSIDYTVHNHLRSAGLVDTYTKNRIGKAEGSVPTDAPFLDSNGLGIETHHPIKEVRLDYILATPKLAMQCVGSEIIKSDITKTKISDHFPVTASFV